MQKPTEKPLKGGNSCCLATTQYPEVACLIHPLIWYWSGTSGLYIPLVPPPVALCYNQQWDVAIWAPVPDMFPHPTLQLVALFPGSCAGEEKREPHTQCLRIQQVTLITWILLCYTKTMVNLCLPAERLHCMDLYSLWDTHVRFLKSKTVMLRSLYGCLGHHKCQLWVVKISWKWHP